jgi:hypothetical protein
MVEAMHGSVGAGESPLGGLRITVDLPAAGTAPVEQESTTAADSAGAPVPSVRATVPGSTLPAHQ